MRVLSGILLAVSLTSVAHATAIDACKALLPANGAYKITKVDGHVSTFNSSKDWFCSSDFLDYASQSAAGGGVTVPVDGIPVGASFDQNNNQHMQARHDFCQDNAKQFSEDQTNFLFMKEGDKTLVQGYVDCIKAIYQTAPVLDASAPASRGATFDIQLSSKPFPGDPPSVLSAIPVDNADVVAGIASGSKIPFEGNGTTPIVGTYRFKNNGSAKVLVKTTVGDSMVTAKHCPAGRGGMWKITEEVVHTSEMPGPHISFAVAVPQASCHPHCKNDQGDWHDYKISAPPDSRLVNIKTTCNGNGCQFDGSNVTNDSPSVSTYHIKSRSEGVQIILEADTIKTNSTTTRDTVDPGGDLIYGAGFAVKLDNAHNALLEISGDNGNVELTKTVLQAQQLPPWLKASGPPQPVGQATVFNLAFDAPECLDK